MTDVGADTEEVASYQELAIPVVKEGCRKRRRQHTHSRTTFSA
jgi:hypothetical protein